MVIRLVVAEDSLLVREGIVKLLGAYDDVEIVELCVDLPELLAAVEGRDPHVVLTDIRMPPTGTDEGIRAATELRERHPEVGVVVLSQYVEPTYALKLFDGGSQGRAYLLKERLSEGSQLINAIREVPDETRDRPGQLDIRGQGGVVRLREPLHVTAVRDEDDVGPRA
jgi:DNA-binding NarL/FixJ family response regulator